MVFRLEIFSLKSGVEGPLAAWVWDRRGGARIEGDLRAALLRMRQAAHQLLEVVVTSQPGTGQERLEAGQERLEAGQERLEPGEDRLEAGQERLEAVLKALESRYNVRSRIVQVSF
jgi:hypothetical protein